MSSIVHCVSTEYAMGATIDPENWIDDRGGSNKNFFMNITKELPKYGHHVRVFSTFSRSARRDNVEYYPLSEIDNHGLPHVLWACYDTMPLHGRWGMLRIASHHTYKIDRAPWEHIDINTIPSQAALDFLKPVYAAHADWRVQPNAVENDVDPKNYKPVPGRILYHTSWGRGLRVLMRIWPEIKARVPGASLHVITGLPNRKQDWPPGWENSTHAVHFRDFWKNWDSGMDAGGVTHMSNVPRAKVLQELSEASVFAFPCACTIPCETFSVSTMECCKMGIPVVLSPEDSLESIYKDHVLMTPAPVEKNLEEFTDAVVQVLRDPVVAARYSKLGKELAAPYTYENAGRVLSKIIYDHTGFKPTAPLSIAPTPEIQSPAPTPVFVNGVRSQKKLAFLLDPKDCGRPINPEKVDEDSRGLTGSEVTSFRLALEMGRRGYDVTWYTNLTQNFEGRGIKFAKWDRWEQDSKQDWHAAVATLNPACLAKVGSGTIRVFNQQVNDFRGCPGWEQHTDIVTALSLTHQRQLRQFSNFSNWQILNNGCDPTEYYDGKRDNKRLVWASSHDRGLHWLLELYPNLKKRVPDAEIHIYYHFNFDAKHRQDEEGNRYRYIEAAIDRLKGKGVTLHGSTSRQEMKKVFSEGRILAYPCDPTGFTEGFGCTVLEAAVAGCLPVIVGADAFAEIYSDYVPVTPAPYPKHKEHYLENLVKYLTDDAAYQTARSRGKEMAKTHSWQSIGQQLVSMLKL
jgi:glycosyltransferase involved in cell wall biosynthesis